MGYRSTVVFTLMMGDGLLLDEAKAVADGLEALGIGLRAIGRAVTT